MTNRRGIVVLVQYTNTRERDTSEIESNFAVSSNLFAVAVVAIQWIEYIEHWQRVVSRLYTIVFLRRHFPYFFFFFGRRCVCRMWIVCREVNWIYWVWFSQCERGSVRAGWRASTTNKPNFIHRFRSSCYIVVQLNVIQLRNVHFSLNANWFNFSVESDRQTEWVDWERSGEVWSSVNG